MNSANGESDQQSQELLNRLEVLERRLVKVESLLRLEWVGEKEEQDGTLPNDETTSAERTESTIVEYGLAWLGGIVLFLSIVFLNSYISGLGYELTGVIVGYLCALAILGLSHYLKRTLPIITRVFTLCSSILLYYLTISLHFFSTAPVLDNKFMAIALVMLVIAYQLFQALRKRSERQALLGILFLFILAIISDSTSISLGLLTLVAFTSVGLLYYYQWWKLTIISIFLVYFAHLLWLFGNPVMGHKIGLVSSGQNSIYYLFSYAIAYVASILIPNNKIEKNSIIVGITVWNALMFSLLLLLTVPALYAATYELIFTGIALLCLLLSVYLKLNPVRDFAPATYASFGFAALSLSIYGFAGLPNAYFVFALQSFFVVLIALWYRSQIIVVINVFLFIFILLAYLVSSDSVNSINFVLAITALSTARIINWKKERLTLKTEIYRNIYLIIASLMLLYSLEKALPTNYVTISWSITAILFFVISILIKKIKYRFMAIFTLIASAGHIFFIDMRSMDLGYRVIAFMAFAMISIGLSLYYTKKIRKN